MKKFLTGFACAFKGIGSTVLSERNMRIHIVVMLYVFYFSSYYSLSKTEYILLILTCAAVIALETVNTAIEAVVDKASPEYSKLAKISKNAAAGAVLIMAIAAVGIGLILFLDFEVIGYIFTTIFTDIRKIAILFATVALSFLFIRGVKKKKDKGQTEK